MPIRPELRHFYRGPGYEKLRKLIMERAKNRCEQCGKPNHRQVYVISIISEQDGRKWQFWTSLSRTGRWLRCADGVSFPGLPMRRTWRKEWRASRKIRVVLTMAHLDHNPEDNDPSNLKILCQWCHLHYDQLHHKETRSIRKDAKRPVLQAAS